jgi:hypothetical protein
LGTGNDVHIIGDRIQAKEREEERGVLRESKS